MARIFVDGLGKLGGNYHHAFCGLCVCLPLSWEESCAAFAIYDISLVVGSHEKEAVNNQAEDGGTRSHMCVCVHFAVSDAFWTGRCTFAGITWVRTRWSLCVFYEFPHAGVYTGAHLCTCVCAYAW